MITIILKLLALALILVFCAYIIPGITVVNFSSAIIAAIVIALINVFIKPALVFITMPINILTLGISILFINALLFSFVGYLVPGVKIDNFLSAFLGALVISLLSIGLSRI